MPFHEINKAVRIYSCEPDTTHVRRIEDAISECMKDHDLSFIWLSPYALKLFAGVDAEYSQENVSYLMYQPEFFGVATVSGPYFSCQYNDDKVLAMMPFKNGLARLILVEVKVDI